MLVNEGMTMSKKILKKVDAVKNKTYDFESHSFVVNSVFSENSGETLFTVLLRLINCDTHDKQDRV